MKNNKKANAFIWVFGLISLFIVAIAFTSTTPVMQAFDSNFNRSDWTTAQNNTWTKIYTSWSYWPAIAILAIVLFSILRTLRVDVSGGFR